MTIKLRNLVLVVAALGFACSFDSGSAQAQRTRKGSGNSPAAGVNRRARTLNRATALAIIKDSIPASSHLCNDYRNRFGNFGHFIGMGLHRFMYQEPTDDMLLRHVIDFSSFPKGVYLELKLLDQLSKAGIIHLATIAKYTSLQGTVSTEVTYVPEPNSLIEYPWDHTDALVTMTQCSLVGITGIIQNGNRAQADASIRVYPSEIAERLQLIFQRVLQQEGINIEDIDARTGEVRPTRETCSLCGKLISVQREYGNVPESYGFELYDDGWRRIMPR